MSSNAINVPDYAVVLKARRAAADQPWLVLCHLPDNDITPFVTWMVGPAGAYWGEYCSNAVAAERSFQVR